MISTAGTDPRSGVFQGRQGTGEATVFNSGNFDPVNMWQRRYEQARVDDAKRVEEKKKKLANLDLLKDYVPQREEFSKAIYETFDKGIDAYADAMAQGHDPFDMSTDLGRSFVKFRGELAGMAQAEQSVVDKITAAKKAMDTSPEKYDVDVFAETMREYEAAPDWKSKAEVLATKPLLAPQIDYLEPIEAIKEFIKPNIVIRDIDGQTRVEEEKYDVDRLAEVTQSVLALPQFQKFKAKYDKDPTASMPYEQFIMSKFIPVSKEKKNPSGNPFGGNTTVITNDGFANKKWSITKTDAADINQGYVIGSQGTSTEGAQNPAVTMEVDGEVRKVELYDMKPDPSGYWFFTVREKVRKPDPDDTSKIGAKKMIETTETRKIPVTKKRLRSALNEMGLLDSYNVILQELGWDKTPTKEENKNPAVSGGDADQYLNQLLGK